MNKRTSCKQTCHVIVNVIHRGETPILTIFFTAKITFEAVKLRIDTDHISITLSEAQELAKANPSKTRGCPREVGWGGVWRELSAKVSTVEYNSFKSEYKMSLALNSNQHSFWSHVHKISKFLLRARARNRSGVRLWNAFTFSAMDSNLDLVDAWGAPVLRFSARWKGCGTVSFLGAEAEGAWKQDTHQQLHYLVGTIPAMVCMNMKKNDKAGISPVSQFIAFTVLFNPLFYNVLQMVDSKAILWHYFHAKECSLFTKPFAIVKDLMALQFTGLG